MIGIWGSGKTTAAKKLQSNCISMGQPTDIISFDDIKNGLRLSGNNKTDIISIIDAAKPLICSSLELGHNVICDGLNLAIEDRKPLIDIGKSYNTTLIGVQVITPITIAVERNVKRGILDSNRLIWKQQGRYYPASKKEFDKIITIDVNSVRKY